MFIGVGIKFQKNIEMSVYILPFPRPDPNWHMQYLAVCSEPVSMVGTQHCYHQWWFEKTPYLQYYNRNVSNTTQKDFRGGLTQFSLPDCFVHFLPSQQTPSPGVPLPILHRSPGQWHLGKSGQLPAASARPRNEAIKNMYFILGDCGSQQKPFFFEKPQYILGRLDRDHTSE